MSKRILIFSTTYFPLVGGAEVAMKEITDRLPEWEFDLVCARIVSGLASKEKIGNVTVHRCGFGFRIDKYLLPLFGVCRACSIIRDQQSIAGIWSLMASYAGFAALAYTWIRPKTKMLLTLQEGDPLEHYAKRLGVLNFLHSRIFRRADRVQAISRFLADWAKRMGFRGTLDIVPNGVDVEKFSRKISTDERQRQRLAFGCTDDQILIVTASRLSQKNAVHDLISSLSFLPERFHLVIAGVGEDEEKSRALTKEKGLTDRVHFLGKKTHDELPAILQSCEMFCRPSLSEGLGNAFLEAMAAEIPVIATPVGGILDFLEDGETGVFCQPNNPESIAQVVLHIDSNPAMRDELVKNAEAVVRCMYGWNGIAKKMDAILKSL